MLMASLNKAVSIDWPFTFMAISSQYCQLLSDYGPPSLDYTQRTGNSQVPQSKHAELLIITEGLEKVIRYTSAEVSFMLED